MQFMEAGILVSKVCYDKNSDVLEFHDTQNFNLNLCLCED